MEVRSILPIVALACTPASVVFDGSNDRVDASPVFPIDPVVVPSYVVEGPTVYCDSPGVGFTRHVDAAPATTRRYLWSSGLMIGDLDGDGWHDVVSPSEPWADL